MQVKRDIAPDAVEVSALNDLILRVKFENGETRDFDAKEQLLPRKGYASLSSPAVFQRVHIEYGVVTWENGLDLDPEWLYEESKPAR